MARYLVTGVAGFIASRTAEFLLNDGHQVVGVDNMNNAYDVRIKEYRLHKLTGRAGFSFHQLDISEREALSALDGYAFDAIFNLAARAGVRQSVENPWVYIQTNITGTLNLLEMCRHRAIPKFILASTSSIYGANAPLPTPEDADSSRPLSPYAASKKGAEALCHSYHSLFGVDVSIFRYFTVYVPAGRPDMSMFRFTKWITEGCPLLLNGDGQQSRAFTYVDDIARGTILGLRPLGYEIINLGGHEPIKIIDLIHWLEELIGKKALIETQPANPADMLANQANVEKAMRLIGWEPRVSLSEGIANLIAWYNAERTWASLLET